MSRLHFADIPPETRNCGSTEADQCFALIVCIALKIASQRSGLICFIQAVCWLGEVVDANRSKASRKHCVACDVGQFETLLCVGQGLCFDQNLTFGHPRHMRIAVDREAIGVHVNHMRKRLSKAVFCLKWQAVEQIKVDRLQSGST